MDTSLAVLVLFVHTVFMDVEYSTITITPASMTKRNRFAQRRAEELARIKDQGWEIVSIEPERIFRRGDKVTVRRDRAAGLELAEPVAQPASTAWGRAVQWWDGLTQTQQIGVGLAAIAILVTFIAAF